MKISKKLKEIYRKIAELEKESPYNYCDRWCERCSHEKQMRCEIYKDELERRITCIAHGREEDDPEITKAVMEAQYNDIDGDLESGEESPHMDLDYTDPEDLDEDDLIDFEELPPEVQKHIRFIESNPLLKTAENYAHKAHCFLEKTFFGKRRIPADVKEDFLTVAWYHTLIPAKLRRALSGFHEPMSEGDLSLYDSVGQFNVCLKGIRESVRSFNNIKKRRVKQKQQILLLLALLRNMESRIKLVLEGI
jgi:hypothetical protein